jgi:SAM-dependent methyltransferase
MGFAVPADAYDRFMGRYSVPLAPLLADLAGVEAGQHVLDVGCVPGAMTAELARRVGADRVAAVDPSESFVEACRARHPGVDVRPAPAEQLPFDDDAVDVAVAQLVVHFMADPVAGLREMARVTRPGGTVAACVWDFEEGGPLNLFWDAVRSVDPAAGGELALAGTRRGQLVDLFGAAGLAEVEGDVLAVDVRHETFDEWWEPFTLGVGPAGAYVAALDDQRRGALRDRCRELHPEAPFTVTARAWAARGTARK